MATIVITKESEFNWDIAVYEKGKIVKRTWGNNRDQAIGKAELLREYFTDDNGQMSSIKINDIL